MERNHRGKREERAGEKGVTRNRLLRGKGGKWGNSTGEVGRTYKESWE